MAYAFARGITRAYFDVLSERGFERESSDDVANTVRDNFRSAVQRMRSDKNNTGSNATASDKQTGND